MHEFTEDEQVALLSLGLANLRVAGAENVCAFRAGNYGANFDTLRALARVGIRYDTSLNPCYLDATCRMRTPEPLLQPADLYGVREYPVSYFRDGPGHSRHAQLCSCSARELRGALLQAWEAGWESFVIVSHSFERIGRRKQTATAPRPDRIVIGRFERLCEFLGNNRDKFHTATFSELGPAPAPEAPPRALRSRVDRTAGRMAEQMVRRLVCPT